MSPRWFWAACVLLAGMAVMPLALVEYPGMPDYPNHLARAHIIVQDALQRREHPYYELRHVLVPNLALDVLVPLIARAGVDVATALKLFAAVALLLPVAGVIALAWVLQRRTPWLALLAFPLAFSRYYAWGFLNYFFALGLALLAFALWLSLRARRPWVAGLTLAIAGVATMLSHLMGLGILALLVVGHEARLGWGAPRSDWRRSLPALLALAACLVFYLMAFERGLGLDLRWTDTLTTKLRGLSSPFKAYDTTIAVAIAALLVGLLVTLRVRSKLAMHTGWWVAAGTFVAAYLLLPSVIMNSYFANARLLIVAALVGVGYASLRGTGGPERWAIFAVALLATGLKTAEVHAHWSRTSASTATLRDALQLLPRGARTVTVITIAENGGSSGGMIYPLRHVAAFAVMDRDAFIPNFFGFPLNGEAVAFRPETLNLLEDWQIDRMLYGPADAVPWEVLCSRYDAVLMLEQGHRAEMPACASPLRLGSGWSVWRLGAAGNTLPAAR